jgi:hypothetical protein
MLNLPWMLAMCKSWLAADVSEHCTASVIRATLNNARKHLVYTAKK